MRLLKKLLMRHFKLIVLIFPLIFSISLSGKYKINITYESGVEFNSQQILIGKLENSQTRRQIENLIISQDWIESYSLIFKPFKKEVYLNIKNREPIFALNKKYFFDKELYQFKYNFLKDDLIMVSGPVDNPGTILELINKINLYSKQKFKIQYINFNHVDGWEIESDNTKVKFGKELTEKKFKKFRDTLNYLIDIEKIPSIIDMRYRDGVALNYGK